MDELNELLRDARLAGAQILRPRKHNLRAIVVAYYPDSDNPCLTAIYANGTGLTLKPLGEVLDSVAAIRSWLYLRGVLDRTLEPVRERLGCTSGWKRTIFDQGAYACFEHAPDANPYTDKRRSVWRTGWNVVARLIEK